MKQTLHRLVFAALFCAAASAHASSVTSATVYVNTPDPGNAGDTANEGAGLASANFTIGTGGINFLSPPSSYTVGSFLNNPTFSNQVNGFDPTSSIGSIELVISGTLTLDSGANSFVVGHDDGAVLTVAGLGTVLNVPGPTGYVTTPFDVTAPSAGDYGFTLYYAECCGAPADLTFAINSTTIGTVTPEPSSFILLGSGLLSAAGLMRRRLVHGK